MKLFATLLTIFSLSLGTVSMADESDQLGKFVGEKLDLFYTDHGISGHVDGKLVFASPRELTHRAFGKNFHAKLAKGTKGILEANVLSQAKDEKGLATTFVITKVDGKNGIVEGKLGEDEFRMTIRAKEMEGSHYVNPTFEITLPKTTYSYRLENGKLCINCTLDVNFTILSMLRLAGVI